jgi:hypothetical protein
MVEVEGRAAASNKCIMHCTSRNEINLAWCFFVYIIYIYCILYIIDRNSKEIITIHTRHFFSIAIYGNTADARIGRVDALPDDSDVLIFLS